MNIAHSYPTKFSASIARFAARAAAALLVLRCLCVQPAAAEWQVRSRENLPSPGAETRLQRIKAADSGGARAELVCLVFSQKRCALRVADRPDPSSPRLGPAMREGGFLCGVNGGFFGKRFEPLGWVVSGGREISPLLRAKLLTGAFYHDGRRARLSRVSEIKRGARATEALQAGPFLVDRGEPVAGLESTRPAARTFLATDGGDLWAVGVIFSPTLAGAASLLAAEGVVEGLRLQRALNLDGGRSTGFWAAQPGGAALYYEEISDVRNYLGVIPLGAD